MPRAEPKKTVGVPVRVYNEMAKYADKKQLFIGEVVELVWDEFCKKLNKKNR